MPLPRHFCPLTVTAWVRRSVSSINQQQQDPPHNTCLEKKMNRKKKNAALVAQPPLTRFAEMLATKANGCRGGAQKGHNTTLSANSTNGPRAPLLSLLYPQHASCTH